MLESILARNAEASAQPDTASLLEKISATFMQQIQAPHHLSQEAQQSEETDEA